MQGRLSSEWAPTYERVVQDEMDLRLLERLTTINWGAARAGRSISPAAPAEISARPRWAQGVPHLVGIDLTPEMLSQGARARGLYDHLLQGDLRATGLPPAGYDLATVVLADEHLPDLSPLYAEAAWLTAPGGRFVIVGYHPFFLMIGIPTHFDRADGTPAAIEGRVHLFSDHVRAAQASGFALLEMAEGVIDDAWLAKKPKWERSRAIRSASPGLIWGRAG